MIESKMDKGKENMAIIWDKEATGWIELAEET
jgi:hypothetical protein